MAQGLPTDTSTVILLETEPALRRVISLGLCHQGLNVVAAPSLNDVTTSVLATADLLIVDLDDTFSDDWPLLEIVQQHPQLAALPSVVLSWDVSQERIPSAIDTSRYTFLAKPFDARAMQRQVRELLLRRIVEKNAALARAEEHLLASQQRPRASIWPLITALGLLLVVSGILWQLFIALAGIVIVATGFLLWTLGNSNVEAREMLPA